MNARLPKELHYLYILTYRCFKYQNIAKQSQNVGIEWSSNRNLFTTDIAHTWFCVCLYKTKRKMRDDDPALNILPQIQNMLGYIIDWETIFPLWFLFGTSMVHSIFSRVTWLLLNLWESCVTVGLCDVCYVIGPCRRPRPIWMRFAFFFAEFIYLQPAEVFIVSKIAA